MTFCYTPPPASDRRAFLAALDHWSGTPRAKFSMTFPPCNEIAGGDDENALLAQVFSAVASEFPHHEATRALSILHAAIDTHTRHFDLLWQDAKSNPPNSPMIKTTWKDVRRYEQMLCILCMWHDAIFDRFVGAAEPRPANVPALILELEHAT
jgi:hypothetical protein